MWGGIHNAGIVGESSTNLAGTFELPDIISDLQDETGLTRWTIVDILIGSNRLNDFLKNPYDYIQIVKNSIKEVLAKTVIEGVQYEKLPGEVYELRELQSDSQKEEERFINNLYEIKNKQKSITDKLTLDSSNEVNFAKYLDNKEDVKLFLKLPAKFTVPTPVGPYNPDWAIVKESDGQEKIYMVRETKSGSMYDSEKAKIKCAEKHFEALQMNDYVVSTPEDWKV